LETIPAPVSSPSARAIDKLIPVAHDFCKPIYKNYVTAGVLCGVILAQLLSVII
jgi:hypothetical protein